MTLYFIAAVLPAHLNEKVLGLKEMMRERFGCKVGLKSPAHITLIPPCWLDEQQEPDLLQDTAIVASGSLSFPIATDNFSAFKPKTIFVAVQPNAALHQLKKTGDEFFSNRELYKVKIDKRPFHPHITIATRDLTKKTFHEAWPYFEAKTFQEEWIQNSISVLRHNKRNWDVIASFPFQNAS